MTYAEFLKSQGASDEDVKLLDTPLARKAFDKQQADLAAAAAARDKAIEDRTATEDWYKNTATPEFNKKSEEVVKAKAEAEKFRAALRSAKEQGFIDIDDSFFGANPNPNPSPNPNPANNPPQNRDYFTKEEVAQIAEREGDAIAIAQDIAFEHSQLFPGQPLNLRELRKRAVAARKSVEQQWLEEFKVPDARAAAAKKRQEEHDTKMREEGAKAERERLAKDFNPDTRSPMPSTSPFTVRKTAGDIRAKQPWDAPSEGVLSDDRVTRVARKLMTQ